MDSQLSDIRKEYKKGKLTRNTVSPDGRPSTRTVLLKGVENGRFIFFTNYESRKGRQLAANPHISLSFVWHKLERQVHIEGIAERCAPRESDAYFSTRPYKSRIGARISPQSRQTGRTNRAASRQLGRLCRHPHPLRVLAGT